MDPNTVLYYLLYIPTIVIAITFHEFAHARVALAFGDPTAYQEGRVTLNPLAHLDPIGTLGIFFAGFGWGKPTPVNTARLRHPRADLLVSAAGPAMNFLLALVAVAPLHLPLLMRGVEWLGISTVFNRFVPMFVYTNLALGFFNFIPLGPLDGAHVLKNLLPFPKAFRFDEFNRSYGYLMLIGMLVSDRLINVSIISLFIDPPTQFFASFLLGK